MTNAVAHFSSDEINPRSDYLSMSECIRCRAKQPHNLSKRQIKALGSRSKRGDAWASLILSRMHELSKATGKPMCDKHCNSTMGCQSELLLEKAASQSHHEALWILSCMYLGGNCLERNFKSNNIPKKYKDPSKKYELVMLAAKLGNQQAQYYVGYHTIGTTFFYKKTSFKKARKWLEKAIEQGHPDAAYELAEFYEKGLGVEVSLDKAAALYQLAIARAKIPYARCDHSGSCGSRTVGQDALTKLANLEECKKGSKTYDPPRFSVRTRVECYIGGKPEDRKFNGYELPSSHFIHASTKYCPTYEGNVVTLTTAPCMHEALQKKWVGIDQGGQVCGHLAKDQTETELVLNLGPGQHFDMEKNLFVGWEHPYKTGVVVQHHIFALGCSHGLGRMSPYQVQLDEGSRVGSMITVPIDEDGVIRKLSTCNKNEKACYTCDKVPIKGSALLKCSGCGLRRYCDKCTLCCFSCIVLYLFVFSSLTLFFFHCCHTQ